MPEYRLDELAVLSGVSARNIRAYRERGLLDPPRREGRLALYGDEHLAQLRTVNDLLRKGFTTAHIAEFLATTRQGQDLADTLGLPQATDEPGGAAMAVDVDPGGELARRLLEHGLAEVVDGHLTLVNPNVAEIVGRGSDQPHYVETILRLSDGIAALLDELAAEMVRALEESLLTRFGPDYEPSPDDMAELRQMIADYGTLSRRIVADQLEDVLQQHLVNRVSQHGTDLVATDLMLGGRRNATHRRGCHPGGSHRQQ